MIDNYAALFGTVELDALKLGLWLIAYRLSSITGIELRR
jgi:hypothetical protein